MISIRKALFTILTTAIFFSTSCSPLFDEESFRYVENYSLEILPAVEAALADLDHWLGAPGADEPLLERLRDHADVITEINQRYWPELPEDTAIEKWKITRKFDGQEWRIDGKELADALWLAGADSDALAGALQTIGAARRELNEQEYEWVSYTASEAKRAVRWLEKLLFRE